MKKRLLIIFILLILVGLIFCYFNRSKIKDWWDERNKEELPEAVSMVNVVQNNENVNKSGNTENTNQAELPKETNLKVPFTSQAPLLVWDEAHEEACEEAASLMVAYYWQDKSLDDKNAVDKILLDMENREITLFGSFKDTTAEQTAELIKDYFGFKKVDVYYDIKIEDIKKEVANGYPVIVPTAGRLLKNPYFTQPGPVYHMLVVKGYTPDKIITNDNGTKRGADYTYDYDVFYKAIHDWNNGDVENGKKAMIVVRGK